MQGKRKPLGEIGNTVGGSGILRPKFVNHIRVPSLTAPGPPSNPSSPRLEDKDAGNPLAVTAYLKEIFHYFGATELIGRSSGTYMGRIQSDINDKMRTILNDWLVDVHLKFKLKPETLFLAVDCIDRFLDKKVVSRQKLQLVGVVAMLLASKYEEIYPPEVKDFVYIAANTYTRDDILRMERLMFQTLDFNISFPTVYPFLKRALHVCSASTQMHHLAQYFAELSLMEYQMLKHAPSLVGASCVFLANKYLSCQEPWSSNLEYYCKYSLSQVEQCAADILTISQKAPQQKTQAVRKKYSYAKYGEVAQLTHPPP